MKTHFKKLKIRFLPPLGRPVHCQHMGCNIPSTKTTDNWKDVTCKFCLKWKEFTSKLVGDEK